MSSASSPSLRSPRSRACQDQRLRRSRASTRCGRSGRSSSTLCIAILASSREVAAHLVDPGGPAGEAKALVSVALAAGLGGDGLVGGGVAELAKELEGVGGAGVLDRTLGDDFEVTFGIAADDGDLDDKAFVHQGGELAVGKGELAGHGGGGELGDAGEVAALDGGEVFLHHVVMAEGDKAGGEAGAAGFEGALDVAGAGAVVGADGGLAGGERLAEGGGGGCAGADGGGGGRGRA